MYRVCVVGSGPGGMYTSKYLLKALNDKVRIDVIDRLPVCYGLVRYGVAPDHPEVKSVSNDFDQVMEDSRVRFFGNTYVGKDVKLDALKSKYDAVVLSYGASSDKLLNLPNELNTGNVWGAHDFVNWYNGIPDMANKQPPLLDCEAAAIIGQGNVALDCARILTKDVDELAKTDISRTALEMLSQSKIKRVSVVGRRGTAQGAFTIKELRELSKLENVGCIIRSEELKKSLTDASLEEIKSARATKRLNDLIGKIAAGFDTAINQQRIIDLRFLCSPTEILSDDSGRVVGVKVSHNMLAGEAHHQKAVPVENDQDELVDCGLLIRSIGYKSQPIEPDVPFDENRNVLSNVAGKIESGVYTAGWVKRGPTGIIGTNITDARETVDTIVKDLELVEPKNASQVDEIYNGVDFVDWTSYKKIDDEEQKRGQSLDKDREKILTVGEMLAVAKNEN